MALTKYISSALAVAATAYAGPCSSDKTTTIVNPAGASSLAACPTYSGDVVFATGAASLQNTVNLGSIKEIDGSITYESDPQVGSILAPQLTKVGDVKFDNLSALAEIGFGSLKEAGQLEFIGLSVLSSLGLGGSLAKAESIVIQNTQVASFDGISTISELSTLRVLDNPFLKQISLALKTIGTLEIGVNGDGLQTGSFPQLKSAGTLIFRNLTSITIPSLANVSQNLELHGTTVQSFSAANLTSTGGLVINDNSKLSNVSFPLLKSISGANGTLQIANNTQLKKISGFPALESVKQDVDLSGAFDQVDLPKLKDVGGAYNFDTSSSSYQCSSFKDNVTVKGKANCVAADPTPERGGQGSSDGSSGSSGSGSGNAAGSVNAPLYLTAITVVASVMSMLLL